MKKLQFSNAFLWGLLPLIPAVVFFTIIPDAELGFFSQIIGGIISIFVFVNRFRANLPSLSLLPNQDARKIIFLAQKLEFRMAAYLGIITVLIVPQLGSLILLISPNYPSIDSNYGLLMMMFLFPGFLGVMSIYIIEQTFYYRKKLTRYDQHIYSPSFFKAIIKKILPVALLTLLFPHIDSPISGYISGYYPIGFVLRDLFVGDYRTFDPSFEWTIFFAHWIVYIVPVLLLFSFFRRYKK